VSGQTIGEASGTSILFLQIFAAAEYFSLNKTLMSDVPPVLVDIILDPYLLNVFPKSLVPTAGYLIALAILGWVLSGVIWRILLQIADASPSATSKSSNVLDKKSIWTKITNISLGLESGSTTSAVSVCHFRTHN
jgi:hypothetical protein